LTAGGLLAAGVILPGNYGAIDNAVDGLAQRSYGSYKALRNAGATDAHNIIQNASVKDIPKYSRTNAPAVQLKGPSTKVGTEHYIATQIQRQRGVEPMLQNEELGIRRCGAQAWAVMKLD
jgi:hypothetical protein